VQESKMDFAFRWSGDPEDLLIEAAGRATGTGVAACVRAVRADWRWRPGLRVLLDHRRLDWRTTDAKPDGEIELLAWECEQIQPCRIATAVDGLVDFGLRQQALDGLEARIPFEFAVFSSLAGARQWLRRASE
jgi:hypothetical protein